MSAGASIGFPWGFNDISILLIIFKIMRFIKKSKKKKKKKWRRKKKNKLHHCHVTFPSNHRRWQYVDGIGARVNVILNAKEIWMKFHVKTRQSVRWRTDNVLTYFFLSFIFPFVFAWRNESCCVACFAFLSIKHRMLCRSCQPLPKQKKNGIALKSPSAEQSIHFQKALPEHRRLAVAQLCAQCGRPSTSGTVWLSMSLAQAKSATQKFYEHIVLRLLIEFANFPILCHSSANAETST